MYCHLVTVEVRVERSTDEWVKLNRFTFDEEWLECLDTKTVESRSAVQEHRVFFNHFFEDVPDFLALQLNHFLRRFDGGYISVFDEFVVDEWLEELECHDFWKSALMQAKFRTNHDHGTTRVIHAFSEQVLTETTLLPFEHVREGAQWTLVRAGEYFTATAVVEESINCFLKHALLVADDDVWSVQLHETTKTVVTVDHTTIKVVQIRSRETTTIEWYEWAKFWWDDRNHVEHHPFRTVGATGFECFNNGQTLGKLGFLSF